MATLKLAAKLKQSLDNVSTFDSHPMQSAGDEDRLNYLKALSLMVYADQSRHPEEVAYFGALVRTLKPAETTLDRLLAFAESPDFSDALAMMETLRKQEPIGIAFLMDMTMLATVNAGVGEEEKAVIGACRGFLGWDHTIYNRWYTYCATVAGAEKSEALPTCLTALPALCTEHVLQHRGMNSSTTGAAWDRWSKETLRGNFSEDFQQGHLEPLLAKSPPESMASKIKKGLEAAAVFTTHPLKEAGLEDKMNYLKALSLVMAADERIAPEEQAFFGAATRTLVGNDMLQGLLAYALEPDLSEIAAMIETMAKSHDYQMTLVLDAVMLANADGSIHQDEKDLIEQLRKIVKWDLATFDAAYTLSIALVTQPEGLVLDTLCLDMPTPLIGHILAHRGITITTDHDVAAELGIVFENIRPMSYGEVLNGNQISKGPVTVRQFQPFFCYLASRNELQVVEGKLCLTNGDELVALSGSGLTLTDENKFSAESEENAPLKHLSPMAASMYCKWLNSFGGRTFSIPHVKGDSDQWVSIFTGSKDILVRHGRQLKIYAFDDASDLYLRMSHVPGAEENLACPGATLHLVTNSENNESCESPATQMDVARGDFLSRLIMTHSSLKRGN